jgi:hypothetical protein
MLSKPPRKPIKHPLINGSGWISIQIHPDPIHFTSLAVGVAISDILTFFGTNFAAIIAALLFLELIGSFVLLFCGLL